MKKYKILAMSAIFLLSAIGMTVTSVKAEQNTQAGAYLAQLGEFKVTIAGNEITLPMSYKELENRGWTFGGVLEPVGFTRTYQYVGEGPAGTGVDRLVPAFSSDSISLVKDNARVSVGVYNGETSEQRFSDMNISYLSQTPAEDELGITLPGNIVIGKSTIFDLKAAYGEPTWKSVSEEDEYFVGMIEIKYEIGDHQTIYFLCASDSKKIYSVEIFNQKDVFQKADEQFTRSPEVLNYRAPSSLGTDLSKLTYEFEGDVYQFPTPLAAFVDKGWKLTSSSRYYNYINPGYRDIIKIERNGITEYLEVENYGEERTHILNCYTKDMLRDIVLPNGLKRGMSEKDALAIIERITHIYDSENHYYWIKGEDSNAEIELSFGDGRVSDLRIQMAN